jgi:hypothetical protein
VDRSECVDLKMAGPELVSFLQIFYLSIFALFWGNLFFIGWLIALLCGRTCRGVGPDHPKNDFKALFRHRAPASVDLDTGWSEIARQSLLGSKFTFTLVRCD